MDSSIVSASVQSDKSLSASKKDSTDKNNNELFQLNQVYYRMPPSLSLVSKRTLTKGFFQQTQYPKCSNGTIVMTVNTGEFYVSPKTSYLVIQCGIDLANYATIGLTSPNNVYCLLGQGDIMNLIDEVFFTSASGTEICREQNKCMQSALIHRAQFSQEYLDTAGQISGYPKGKLREIYDRYGYSGHVAVGTDAKCESSVCPVRDSYILDNSSGDTKGYYCYNGSVDLCYHEGGTDLNNKTSCPTFIVPMSRLLGCFAPYMNVLFPAAALAGGQLTIRFKNFTESLIATGASIPDTKTANALCGAVDIKNIYCLWDSFQLNDSVLKRLNEVAAGSEGLSVMFDCWDWARTQTSSLSVEAQISQARSRITRSLCIIRDSANLTNPWANSLAAEAAINRESGFINPYLLSGASTEAIPLVRDYQAQLGSLYFPQQPLVLPEEYVMNLYYILGKNYLDLQETSSVSMDDFYGVHGVNQYTVDGNINPPNWETKTGGKSWPPAPPLSWSLNYGMAMYGFLAERGQLLQLTGLPISNARLLRHKFTFNYDTASKKDRVIDTFTQYTRCMKVFLGGRVVMRE